MKKLAALAFLFIFTTIIFAQKTISGKVYGENKKPLPSASVTIEEIGKNAILSYAITDSNGNYKVTFTSNDSKINVKVKAFNHKTIVNQYENATQTQNFTLEEQATEIKEVKLKTKLVTKRGDTITYDLKSFESKADRTLADVLKKMPGVEVNKDGSILYQGEPINKFYVNGKDLMEGGYGTINNSLPKDAVQKVEIMENHQPVKILQDKIVSENAAINVKLKNSVTMTGRGEASLGVAPSLWNLKLSPMLFTPKVQWVLNYKTNNIGDQVERESQIMAFGSRFEGVRRNFSDNSWLGVESAANPSNVPVNRYLFNNVHYVSANLLTSLSKDWEFKANANYANNAIERGSKQMTYNADGLLSNISTIDNNFYTNQAKGEFIFSKNAKKGFFKNTTTYNGLWNIDKAETYNNGLKANQRNTTPSNSFQNSMSAIIPWKEKLVNVMSFINYRNDTQNLKITPASYMKKILPDEIVDNSDLIYQYLNLKTFETIHSASIGFSKNNWTFTPEVGLNYTSNKLITDANGETYGGNIISDLNYENSLKFKKANPYAQLMINFKKNNFDANLTAPVNFNQITANEGTKIDKTLNKTTYEPRLFIRYDLTSFWKLSSFAGINYNFGNINDIYGSYIILSARNVTKKNTDIQENKSQFIGSALEYRNPLNNIFFNVRYNFNDRNNNISYRNILNISTQQLTVTGYNLENVGNSNSVRTELGKYFPKFKTNASVGYNYSISKSQQLQTKFVVSNEDITSISFPTSADFQNVKSNNQGITFKFNNNYFSWLSVDYNASLSFTKYEIFGANYIKNTSENFNHTLSTYIYPIKDHTIGFTWDELQFKNGADSRKNSFYDVSYQYSMAKEKMDIELKVVNIANTNVYQDIRFDSSNTLIRQTSVNIRPRQVLLTVKFNFK